MTKNTVVGQNPLLILQRYRVITAVQWDRSAPPLAKLRRQFWRKIALHRFLKLPGLHACPNSPVCRIHQLLRQPNGRAAKSRYIAT
jgi:hypothetical protein